MQSFLLIHTQKEKRDEYLQTHLKQLSVSPFDISVITGETSIGIEQIRELQRQLLYKPLKGEKKAIIIENAHTLTIEAQNAMLKILEEPPSHTLFFLSANSIDTFLPTILSRCSVIKLEEQLQELTDEDKLALDQELSLLFSQHISNKLFLAEKIAAQKEVGSWLQNVIVYVRHMMLEDIATNKPTNVSLLKNLQEAYHLITTTNTNPRIVLEHTFLTITQ